MSLINPYIPQTNLFGQGLVINMQPYAVRFRELQSLEQCSFLRNVIYSTSLRASTDHSLVSANLNRFGIRAILATRVASTAISVEGNR